MTNKDNSGGKGLNRKGEYWNERKDNGYVEEAKMCDIQV